MYCDTCGLPLTPFNAYEYKHGDEPVWIHDVPLTELPYPHPVTTYDESDD